MKKISCVLLLFTSISFASIAPKTNSKKIVQKNVKKEISTKELLGRYQKLIKDKNEIKVLKRDTLSIGGKAVPVLIQVMKKGTYPDKNRWMATFLLGRIMGKKATPFISKFLEHPNWVLRLASLKTLLALKDSSPGTKFADRLKDKSMIVRVQALQNIRNLGLKEQAPQVWAMLYDKENYAVSKKQTKRTSVIKEAIKTIGTLRFKKAKDPLLKMALKKKYKDIFFEIDSALSSITGKSSPKGNYTVKENYWKRFAMSEKVF